MSIVVLAAPPWIVTVMMVEWVLMIACPADANITAGVASTNSNH